MTAMNFWNKIVSFKPNLKNKALVRTPRKWWRSPVKPLLLMAPPDLVIIFKNFQILNF